MTDRSLPSTGDEADGILEAAVTWRVRLREPMEDGAAAAARHDAFRAWMDADPRHPAAYEEAGRLWGALGMPSSPPVAAHPAVVTRRSTGTAVRRLALAATLLFAVGVGAGWFDATLDRWRSDMATGVGERRTVALEDGSTLVLGSDTALDVAMDGAGRRVRLRRGEVWFDVHRDPDRPFVVTADGGTVRVTGTRFDVRIDDDAAVVSLVEGRVEVRGTDGPGTAPVVLAPGQQARLVAAATPAVRPFDPAVVGAWREGRFVFYETPLADVVATLNRYRPGRILVLGDGIARLPVSGVFNTDDPDAVVSAIAETLPVRVQRLTGHLILLL